MRLCTITLLAVAFVSLTTPASPSQVKPAQIPAIKFIAEATVGRASDSKDQHGSFLPPWREVRIGNIFSKVKPVVGSKVTVIPLGVVIGSFDLKVIKAKKLAFGCDVSEPDAWEVELESIKDKRFFEIPPLPNRRDEAPFDVCVIYPAVPVAHQLQGSRLTPGMLPNGISPNMVKAAVGLTNDQKPDVVIAEFCCHDPSKSEECDYTCGKTFKKVEGKWRLVDEYAPC